MNGFIARFTLVICFLLHFSTDAFAGTLDDYYLQQFGETSKTTQLQKAILSVTPQAPESARCGMPLKHGLRRDWNLLEQTTQKTLAKQLAAPALASPGAFTLAGGGHFKVHYATTGTDAPPLADTNSNGVPDWVETVATTFEDVYANYVSKGYRSAPTAGGAQYDIYLRDLAPQGYYGVTTSDQSASSTIFPNAVTSWMEMDNNYTDVIYKPATYIPLQSLQITAAHEYHHAIQYGYNIFFDIWYAEATSTWMEDELYDDVNQLYSYIPAWFNNSTKPLDLAVGSNAVSIGAGYGRWIFNRFLAEKHTPSMIRGVWEKVAGLPSPGGNADIPMVPVLDGVLSASYGSSIRKEFFEFAKRVYRRDWTTHTSDTSKIHPYSPVATYSEYPVNSSISSSTPSITLPHYSFAYYKFTPSATVPDLTITISKAIGIESTVFKKSSGGIVEISPNSDGISYTITNFSSLNQTTDEVVLLLVNSSSTDGNQSSFSTDGTGITNGVCGISNNNVFTVAPAQNLCNSGTASPVTGTGPWNWNCGGSNGDATCSALIETPIPIENVSVTSGNATIQSNPLTLSDPAFINLESTKPSNLIPTGAITFTVTTANGGTVKIQVVPGDLSWPLNPVFYLVKNTVWTKLIKGTDYLIDNNNNLILSLSGIGINKAVAATIDTSTLVVGSEIPDIPTPSTSGGSSGGCFIATAAYGSYLHPQVQLLRAFRDDYLMTNAPGRAFVEFYYRHSPPLADFITRHTFLRSVTRLSLTPIVVAITHPLISALSLFLLAGAVLLSRLIRIRVRLNAPRQIICTTSSRL